MASETGSGDRDRLRALARLVRRYRSQRAEYARTRCPHALADSITLGDRLDEMVRDILGNEPEGDQVWNKM